jgi:hypothetical protein
MLGCVYFSSDVLHSAEHTAEYVKFSFTYPFGEIVCGFKASHHFLIHRSLYFLWCALKHLPVQNPTSHSLHFSCTLCLTPHAEQMQQFTLEE